VSLAFAHRAQYGSEDQAKEYYAQCICTVSGNGLKILFERFFFIFIFFFFKAVSGLVEAQEKGTYQII